jgi:TatD DNase family protein
MGGCVSFSGILTFRNADLIRDVARSVPLDRLLIETDCPYLAPAPHRGRRCEPAHLVHIAAKLAELRGLDAAALAAATTENFFRLFARAERPE